MRYLRNANKLDTISFYVEMNSAQDSLDSLCLADTLSNLGPSPEETVIRNRNELVEHILSAINKLPEEQRQVVYYRYVDDFSVNTVVSLTEYSIGSIKSRSHYGLGKVRKSLSKFLVEGEYVMNCKDSYAFLFQYAKGKIMDEDKAQVEKHLLVCEDCKKIADSLKELVCHLTPVNEDEIRHLLIVFSFAGESLLYLEGHIPTTDFYEEVNKILAETGGKIPDDYTLISHRQDAHMKLIAEFDNEGNKVEYKIVENPNNPNIVEVVYTRIKKIFPVHCISSVALSTGNQLVKPAPEAPNLFKGKLENAMGVKGKSGLYIAIPGNAKNIRIQKGNGVIYAGPYNFAFSERYITEEETLKLEFTYLKQ